MGGKFNFEKSMEELDKIVTLLENRAISLDDALTLYEDGIALIKSCNAALEEARQKIKVLSDETKAEEKEDETNE